MAARVDAAVEAARADTLPTAQARDSRRLYPDRAGDRRMSNSTEMRYVNAVTQGLRDSMEQDPTVVVLGEDVANAGGSFKATRGLLDTFGAARVIDTPISESIHHIGGRGHGPYWLEAGGGNHVHGFHHSFHGRAGQPGCQGTLHVW